MVPAAENKNESLQALEVRRPVISASQTVQAQAVPRAQDTPAASVPLAPDTAVSDSSAKAPVAAEPPAFSFGEVGFAVGRKILSAKRGRDLAKSPAMPADAGSVCDAAIDSPSRKRRRCEDAVEPTPVPAAPAPAQAPMTQAQLKKLKKAQRALAAAATATGSSNAGLSSLPSVNTAPVAPAPKPRKQDAAPATAASTASGSSNAGLSSLPSVDAALLARAIQDIETRVDCSLCLKCSGSGWIKNWKTGMDPCSCGGPVVRRNVR